MTNEEAREHMDMLIAHKDKAIETHPYFKRCDSCIHSEERDGSNCYECIKGIDDKFEAQPKIGYISIDVNKLAKEVAEKALDEITYEGKTIREWAEILVKQQPSEDCISRKAVIILIDEASEMHPYKVVGDSDTYSNYNQGWSDACDWLYANIEGVPSVTPRTNLAETSQDCISREEMLKYQQYLHGKMSNEENHKLWNFIKGLPSVTPKYTDEEIDKAQAVEQAYVDKMVELAVEESKRPKGKWIVISCEPTDIFKCSECGMRVINPYRYCPNCGAEMSGGEEDEVSD